MKINQSDVDEPEDIIQDIVAACLWNEVEHLRIELRMLAAVNLSRRNVSYNNVMFGRRETSPGLITLVLWSVLH